LNGDAPDTAVVGEDGKTGTLTFNGGIPTDASVTAGNYANLTVKGIGACGHHPKYVERAYLKG
jgi:hypothetical protein